MFMTAELRKELYPVDRNMYPRLQPVIRTKQNFFYPDMPVKQPHQYQRQIDCRTCEWGYNDLDVGPLDPFQDFNDFYNDLRGLLIKPLMCDYLMYKHALAFSLELGFLVINLLTLSFDKVPNSAANVAKEALYTLGYSINETITTGLVIPLFALRAAITLVDYLCQSGRHNEDHFHMAA